MSFRQRHPYLFWQLIGWGLISGDFVFLVISAMLKFGEWCYPVIVFTAIFGLMAVIASPFIVYFTNKKAVPENKFNDTERLIRSKIEAIQLARRQGQPVTVAVSAFISIFVFIFAAYLLGEYVNLALGFILIALSIASPFIIIGIYSAAKTKQFFAVENGERFIDFVQPEDLKVLGELNPRTLVIMGEPDAVLLNFFYNWLRFYFDTERLTLYKVPAAELCRCYQPIGALRYEHILLCIPENRLGLTKEKAALFIRECDIMGAFPFSVFIVNDNRGDML